MNEEKYLFIRHNEFLKIFSVDENGNRKEYKDVISVIVSNASNVTVDISARSILVTIKYQRLEFSNGFLKVWWVRKMSEEKERIINEAKKWLRVRSGTIERKEHLLEILSERFEDAERVLQILLEEKILESNGEWVDVIKVFRGLSREEFEEEWGEINARSKRMGLGSKMPILQ